VDSEVGGVLQRTADFYKKTNNSSHHTPLAARLDVLVAEIPALDVHHIGNGSVRDDAQGGHDMTQGKGRASVTTLRVGGDGQDSSGRLPPHRRLNLHAARELGKANGRILGIQTTDLLETHSLVLGLPIPPHFVDVPMVEEEDGVPTGSDAVSVLSKSQCQRLQYPDLHQTSNVPSSPRPCGR